MLRDYSRFKKKRSEETVTFEKSVIKTKKKLNKLLVKKTTV